MKKKYTTPGIAKVELKPEQAVLGTCSTGVTDARVSQTAGCATDCKADNRAETQAARS